MKKKQAFQILSKILFVFYSVIASVFLVLNIFLIRRIFSNRKAIVESDYPQYYTAAYLVKEGRGEDLYNFEVNYQLQKKAIAPYKKIIVPARNPPISSLLYLPFAQFEFFTSYYLFAIFNVLLLILMVFLSKKLFKRLSGSFLIYLLPFTYYPNELTLVRGQESIFMALIFLVFYHFFNKKPLYAGIVYSLLLIKPHFFLVGLPLFFLISKNKKDFLSGVSISSVALLLLSVLISGIKTLSHYPYFLLSTEHPSFGSYEEVMFSLHNISTHTTNSLGLEKIWVYVFQITLYLLTCFLLAKKSKKQNYDNLFVAACIFTPLFAIHVLPYDLSFTLPIILILTNYAVDRVDKDALLLLFLAILIFILPNLVIAGLYGLSPVILFFVGLYILLSNLKLVDQKEVI